MAINFPSNPNINDTFIVSGTIFTWTGVKWKSTAVTEISSDTSPELSGTLDLNSNDIAGTGNINVTGIITATSFSGNGANLTNLSSAQLTGALPAIDGSNLISGRWTLGANGTSDYTFTGIGFTQTTNDPTLYLKKGEVYEFVNNSGGAHPFQIRESNGGAAYNNGVTNNGAASGTITFEVPYNAPDSLYYQCMNHPNMGGDITILGGGAGVGTETSINTTGIITASAFYGDGSGLTFAPKIIAFDPAALSTGIVADTNITITFDQNIQFAGTGTVELRSTTNSGTIIESFAITSGSAASGLSISGTQLIINPTSSLSDDTIVYVILPSQGIANLTGTYYAGSSNYNFRTIQQSFNAEGGDHVFTLVDASSPTGYYKYHVFTSPTGITTFSAASSTATDFKIMVLGGGGAGGSSEPGPTWSRTAGGGGGAGGLLQHTGPTLALPAGTYTVTVGAGGTGINSPTYSGNPQPWPVMLSAANGNPSKLEGNGITVQALGGGGGGAIGDPGGPPGSVGPFGGAAGGSGGGGGGRYLEPPVNNGYSVDLTDAGGGGIPGQGYAGGLGSNLVAAVHQNIPVPSRLGTPAPSSRFPETYDVGVSGGGGGAGGAGGRSTNVYVYNPSIGSPLEYYRRNFIGGAGGPGLAVPEFSFIQLSGNVPTIPPAILTSIGPTGLYGGGGGGVGQPGPGRGASGAGGIGGGGSGYNWGASNQDYSFAGYPSSPPVANNNGNDFQGGGGGGSEGGPGYWGGKGVVMFRYAVPAP